MKKRILLFAIFMCALAFGLGIFSNHNKAEESDLLIQNLEAIAFIHGGDVSIELPCYSHFLRSDSDQCIICSNCALIDGIGLEVGGSCGNL